MAVLAPDAEPTVKALTQATVMVLGGEPVGERLIWWNFVASSQARIDQAKADWKAGRMSLPDADDLEFIPCPTNPQRRRPPPPRSNPSRPIRSEASQVLEHRLHLPANVCPGRRNPLTPAP